MTEVLIHKGFEQAIYKAIAKKANNKQVVADVGYAAFVFFHNPEKEYAERTENAFIVGCWNKDHLRIIGMATAEADKGKGYATMFVKRAIQAAKKRGLTKIKTRSLSGADFYVKRGFDIIGIKGGDYLLEYTIK